MWLTSGWRTFFLASQWQHTVHRYLRVLHRRMMKRPPKKVTMEDARKAHHIRWPLLSHGTSDEKGIITFILDMWIEGSGLNFSLLLGIMGFGSAACLQSVHSSQVRVRRSVEFQPAPPDATAARPCRVDSLPLLWFLWTTASRWVDNKWQCACVCVEAVGGETSFEMQIQSCALYDAPSLAALARYFQCSRNNNK